MKIQKYKKGNIVFFHGQNQQSQVFLCKSGEFLCTQVLEGRPRKKTRLTQGSFFGIKSGFGAKTVDETVQALTDGEIYILSSSEFLGILKKKPQIIFLILKNFFEELRSSHREIEQKMGSDDEEQDIEIKLFHIGEFYETKSMFVEAIYVYERFIKFYPKSKMIDEVKNKMENIKNNMAGAKS